jgi:hypothetical protein
MRQRPEIRLADTEESSKRSDNRGVRGSYATERFLTQIRIVSMLPVPLLAQLAFLDALAMRIRHLNIPSVFL